MSIAFSGRELIDIAIGIETRGAIFYDIMCKSTQNAEARAAFQYLADMERDHIQAFHQMLGNADKHQEATLDKEYAAYVQALIDSAVFSDDLITSEMATQADNDDKALELAITAEKDSILFYYEMKEIMAPPHQVTVNHIITEEKSHLRQLSQLKKKLAAL